MKSENEIQAVFTQVYSIVKTIYPELTNFWEALERELVPGQEAGRFISHFCGILKNYKVLKVNSQQELKRIQREFMGSPNSIPYPVGINLSPKVEAALGSDLAESEFVTQTHSHIVRRFKALLNREPRSTVRKSSGQATPPPRRSTFQSPFLYGTTSDEAHGS